MTKAFKIGIGNLLLEFLAHTLVFLCTLNSARAVTACPLQALFNCLYCFFVGIKCYFHLLTPQFLRRLPLISSLDYTIYRNPKIVKHASASHPVRVDNLKQSILHNSRDLLCANRSLFVKIVSVMQNILCPSVTLSSSAPFNVAANRVRPLLYVQT